jgi:hypothetical protein
MSLNSVSTLTYIHFSHKNTAQIVHGEDSANEEREKWKMTGKLRGSGGKEGQGAEKAESKAETNFMKNEKKNR